MANLIYSYGKQTIDKNDIETLNSVLKSPYLTQGPQIEKFEHVLCAFTGAKYATVVSSGTAALHLACLALGITKGEEGITSPLTFVASANCLLYCGATVKFADICPNTGLINPEEIIKHISKKTKVIIPVHYAGQSCDMEKIAQIANKHKLSVIEDASHAIGSDYKNKKVGSCQFSDMCIFSFHPVKTITTGEGGAITTNSKELYEKLKLYRTHGITKEIKKFTNPNHLEIGPWYYEMHELGFNYRLTDLQAALGISQLKKLNEFAVKRNEIFRLYVEEFKNDARFKTLPYNKKTVYHLFPLLLQFQHLKMTKVEVFKELNKQGIYPQVHYIPAHLQPYYSKNLRYFKENYPYAELFYEQEMSLPLYPNLKLIDIKHIVSVIKKSIH